MSYSKAGRYGSIDGYPISKSTVYRLIRDSDFYVDENLTLINNSFKVHVQIDEKFVRFTECKNENIKFGFRNEYEEMPLDLVSKYPFNEIAKYDIDTRGIKYETHRMFEKIKYGYSNNIC